LAVRVAALGLALGGLGVLAVAGRAPTLRVGGAVVALGVLSAAGDTGGNLFYILANAEGDLAVTVVLASLYPISTAILARLVLGERLTRRKVMGVAAAMVGVVLITLGTLQAG
jgi:drug/metabolite transporter (DMT)-like permease